MSLFTRGTKARALQDQCDRLLARNQELLQRLTDEVAAHEATVRSDRQLLDAVKDAHHTRVSELETRIEQLETDLGAERDAHRATTRDLKTEKARSFVRGVSARRWAMHLHTCETARALDEEDASKADDQ